MSKPGDEIAPTSYRKKPVVIQAIRWSGTNLKEVIDFTGLHPSADKWTWAEYEEVVRTQGFKLFSLEGPHIVSVGDYVIRGVKGEFYACKPDIFWMTYERADAIAPSSTVEVIPVADIERQIAHIKQNGMDLAKYGGQELDEGRCRELCAMYLHEFIQNKRMGDRLAELDLSRRSARAAPTDSGQDICTITFPDEWADEIGVERFAKEMFAKLTEKRLQGHSGWNYDCTDAHLERLLQKHIEKPWDARNMVDIANFLMMLWNRKHPTGATLDVRSANG